MAVEGDSNSLVAWLGGGLTVALASIAAAVGWGRMRTLIEAQGKRMDAHDDVDKDFRIEMRKSLAAIHKETSAIRESVAMIEGKIG